MLTLGVETSGRSGTIALLDGSSILAVRDLETAGRRHAQTLVAEVQSLLCEFRYRPNDCGLVAVSIGPGSFTGLRVGVVFAKTFAWATKCPVTAVSTFQAMAEECPQSAEVVHVIDDAQRGDLFSGDFRPGDHGERRCSREVAIRSIEDWGRARNPGDAVAGPGVKKLDSATIQQLRVLSDHGPSAETVARIGQRSAANDEFSDVWTLEPFYLRRSAAEEKLPSTG